MIIFLLFFSFLISIEEIILEPQKIQQQFILLLGRLVQILALIYVYLPIIIGILYPMLFLIPIFYTSGVILASPSFPSDWLSAYYLLSPDEVLPLIIFETFIFFTGCTLFLVGLIQLTQAKQRRENIVQVGIYYHIRHPQHLGIIVITFPFSLYIPWINDFGIRVGDLVTWIFFSLLLIIYSDIEDYRLKKRFPEEFSVYQAKTGLIFPKIVHLNQFQLKWIKKNRFRKYSLLVILLFIFLVTSYFIVVDLMKKGILIAFK